MGELPSREELEAAHCWEDGDHVPRWPAATAFRRLQRYHQARWREAAGHPIGTQPIVPRDSGPARPVGSRVPLDYARDTGASFLTPAALDAVRSRSSVTEPHQSRDAQRTWADLLWAPSLAYNLFGDLAADVRLADRALRAWWPDVPGSVAEVRFEHSPGWLDPAFLGNLISFDAAFVLDLGDGTQGVVGIDVTYHEPLKALQPKPQRLPRYEEVARRSGLFRRDTIEHAERTDLLLLWLGHLLALSMVQHPSDTWRWCRFVVVRSAGRIDVADACERYRRQLVADEPTFDAVTLEDLLGAGALPRRLATALRARYVPD